jgi:hypothetical protein
MATLREEAEYLRLALAMGLLDKDAAVAWADRTILALDNPPIEVIEVSMAGNQPPDEMMKLLAAIPGEGDLTAAAHRVLKLLRDQLEAGKISLEEAADRLWTYHVCASVPEDERLQAGNFSDCWFCAQQGYWGSPDSVREDVMSFLAQQTSPPKSA